MKIFLVAISALGLFGFINFAQAQVQPNFGPRKSFKKSGPIHQAPPAASAETRATEETSSSGSHSSAVVWDNSDKYEIGLSSLVGQITSWDGTTTIDVGGSASYFIRPKIQVGGELGFRSMSGGGYTASGMLALATGAYNISPNGSPRDAFFIKAGLGFAHQMFGASSGASVKDETKLTLMAAVGKRFPITSSLTIAPEIRLLKVDGVPQKLVINPVSISYLF